MTELFQLRSRDDGATFELTWLNREGISAELRAPEVNARLNVWVLNGLGLGPFFRDLARHWRGWEGPRTLASLEGELTLTATMDRAGHVFVVVSLRQLDPGPPLHWRLEYQLVLEAGQLDRIADLAAQFEAAMPAPGRRAGGAA